MTQHMPRFHAHHQAINDARKLARILLETGEAMPIQTVSKATLPGDIRRLRGIPVAGATTGTSPNTDPVLETIRRNDPRPPRR